MAGLFVTGTDTEVGKTVVTGLLARAWLDRGLRVTTQKWVQSGCLGFPEDIATHLAFMGRSRDTVQDVLPLMCPYCFELPAAAHLAAEAGHQVIDPDVIKERYHGLDQAFDRVLVEGMGGALVPYSRRALLIDIASALGLPVLIVAKNRLGAINHTLLTIEALHRRDMHVLGVVFNGPQEPDDRITRDNPQVIQDITGIQVLGQLPWTDNPARLQAAFSTIGDTISSEYEKSINSAR